MFAKDHNHLATFRENTTQIGAELMAENQAQIDFWLTKACSTNMCLDAQSRLDIYMNSDYYFVELKSNMKLKAPRKNHHQTKRFCKPTPEQFRACNDCLDTLPVQNTTDHTMFNKCLTEAADGCLSLAPSTTKRPYLSRLTWGLIEGRH